MTRRCRSTRHPSPAGRSPPSTPGQRPATASREPSRTIRFATPARFPYGMYSHCPKERWCIEGVPALQLEAGSGARKASAAGLVSAPSARGRRARGVPVCADAGGLTDPGHTLEYLRGERQHPQTEHTAGVIGCGAPATPRVIEARSGRVRHGPGRDGARRAQHCARRRGVDHQLHFAGRRWLRH